MAYFLPFNPQAKVNYIFILMCSQIAEAQKDKIINYTSINKLSVLFKYHFGHTFSTATLRRYFVDDNYKDFLIINKKFKTIEIIQPKNNFIILQNNEIQTLLKYNDNFLCKYLFYIIRYSGNGNGKPSDFTAPQFLKENGYSPNSNSQISRCCQCNRILEQENLIKIKKYKDKLGHERNVYLIQNRKYIIPKLKNEPLIADLLDYINYSYIKEYKFFCLPQYRFDFFVNNSYIIEYDGQQHFQAIANMGGDAVYKTQHAHDLIKNKYCFKNNIPIIRIPYNVEYTIDDLKLETTRFLLTPENEKKYYELMKD